MLPNERAFKFDTDNQGALRIEFSNKGRYLAVACTMQNSKTIIKIYDVEYTGKDPDNQPPKVVLRGHHDLIHDLNWAQNDKWLVSASADGSAKIWDLSEKIDGSDDAQDYTKNDATYYHDQLLHPSFVYSAKVYPESQIVGRDKLIIATACFDQKIRIWEVSLDITQ